MLNCLSFCDFFVRKGSAGSVSRDWFWCLAQEEPDVYPGAEESANEEELRSDGCGVVFRTS